MAATADREVLTLPALSVELRVSLDLLRKRVRQSAALRALIRRAGPTQFIEASNLARVRELLRDDLPVAQTP